jgi:hypothetical protein
MSLVLEHIGRKSGRDTIIDDVSLMRERGTMNVLLGPTLADQTVKYWYEQTLTDNLASQRKLANEKPPAETIDSSSTRAPPRPAASCFDAQHRGIAPLPQRSRNSPSSIRGPAGSSTIPRKSGPAF